MKEDVRNALLEAIWVMRWNKQKTAMVAVLTDKEAEQICVDIAEELNKIGYEISFKKIISDKEYEKLQTELKTIFNLPKEYYKPSESMEFFDSETNTFYNLTGQALRDPSEYENNFFGDE